ncbi:mannosyl oligosaccharide glucosidase-domain-containing protein, partial [Russula earlei]
VHAFFDFVDILRGIQIPHLEPLHLPCERGPHNVQSQLSESNRYVEDRGLTVSFLQFIYEPLKRHYKWFRRTQRGKLKQYGRKARSRTEAFRWRGRSEKDVLTSGMDDYPRAPPHIGELHLDLLSWMAFFSRDAEVWFRTEVRTSNA